MTIVNDFIKTLIDNPYIIVLAVILIAIMIYVFKKGKTGLYAAALYLVTVAEEEWGSKTGQIKFAEVLANIKKTYPIISLFITESKLKQIIEDALIQMKRILAEKQEKENAMIESSVEPIKEPLKAE